MPKRRPLHSGSLSDVSVSSTVLSSSPIHKSKHVDSIDAILANAGSQNTIYHHDSLLKRWVRWLDKSGRNRSLALAANVGIVVLVKWIVGLGDWSGKGDPPLYGDLEAQRHWLSLTNHLPLKDWYFHDPSHWRLDYPPLTAYHSWLLGKLAILFGNPAWVELRNRIGGVEVKGEEDAIVFMRSSVVVGDILMWMIPVISWCSVALRSSKGGSSKRSSRTKIASVMAILLQPSLILIDNGHFQYNSIMLGFTLLSMIAMRQNHPLLSASLFVCSMAFKQMALFYSSAIFAHLLGWCLYLSATPSKAVSGAQLFTSIAVISIITLAAIFAPLVTSDGTIILQALQRVFPFARGLFEDKVANFWCSINVVIKLRQLFSISTLARMSAALTGLAVLPLIAGVSQISWNLGKRNNPPSNLPPPTTSLLPYTLYISAMSFFMFSFQVHEKSILLPLMPLTLLLAGNSPGSSGGDYEWAILVNNVATFSMYPLLKRDGLALQYTVLTLFWNYCLNTNPFEYQASFIKYLTIVSYTVMFLIHFATSIATPPAHLPDIFTVLNLTFSCAIFGLSLLWAYKRLIEESWALTTSFHSTATSSPTYDNLTLSSSPSTTLHRPPSEKRRISSSSRKSRREDGYGSSTSSVARAAPSSRVRSPVYEIFQQPQHSGRSWSEGVESLHSEDSSMRSRRREARLARAEFSVME